MLKRIRRAIYRRAWWALNYWRFKYLGRYSIIISPLKLQGTEKMKIGKGVRIEYKTWLGATPEVVGEGTDCCLEIGSGTAIGHFNHIYATRKIVIGKKVLTADKVYITDNLHGYEDIRIPIIEQPIRQIDEVFIGDETWLGENVCVIGAKIGKHCVIGANSVVTKDIPDYCVAVGAPAKVVKRYDPDSGKWLACNPDGSFIENSSACQSKQNPD